jgi:MFS family permease
MLIEFLSFTAQNLTNAGFKSAMNNRILSSAVIVSALGYFVDVYDLILFSVVRVASLKDLGFEGEALISEGVFLLNAQMFGMLLGGIIWGVWGDKKGRISVLFGSILMYSVANILNAFVETVPQYALLRFFAGVGLAGELGAGITLVSESLPKEKRGYGTTLVASVGVAGAVAAALVADLFSWRTSYLVGGVMGLMLLVLRVAVHESGMFKRAKETTIKRGNFFMLFRSRDRLVRYTASILVGVPIWYVIGVLVTFSPEFGSALSMSEIPVAGTAVLWAYVGLVVGDIASGVLSQLLRTRKKILFVFLLLTSVLCLVFFNAQEISLFSFYLLTFGLGVAVGYWAVFVTVAAEQFGTNIRATVTTTVPNFVRGAVVLVTLSFEYLRGQVGIIDSAVIVFIGVMTIAVLSALSLKETYGKDLDYVEE